MNRKRIDGMLRLFRLELPFAAGICTVTGQFLALSRLPEVWIGTLGFFSVFCLSSAALILNDYFDVEVDKVNAPDRPYASGLVSRCEIIGLTILTTAAGLFAALALGLDALLVGLILWVIGVLYNWRYKQTGLIGNLMVGTSVAATFIFGAVTVQAPWSPVAWGFGLAAFFLDLGEEIAGDAMDMEGDRKRGSRSIALLKGKRFALWIAVALWGLVVLISMVPVILGIFGIAYLIPILVTDGLLVYFSIQLLRSQTPAAGRKAMRGVYLGATTGIFALLIGLIVA